MPTNDPYDGLPLYLRQSAQNNLRAADRSISTFNQSAQAANAPVPTPASTPAVPSPPVAPPVNLTLGGTPDTSMGSSLPPLQPVNTTTAASRVPDATPTATPKPTTDFIVNPNSNTLSVTYGQTTSIFSQSYQDYQARQQDRRDQRRAQYGRQGFSNNPD